MSTAPSPGEPSASTAAASSRVASTRFMEALAVRRIRAREGAGRSRPAAVADGAQPAVLASLAAVVALTAVDHDRHVRVVLVVLDHLVEELVLELSRDHAIDHPASDCRDGLG